MSASSTDSEKLAEPMVIDSDPPPAGAAAALEPAPEAAGAAGALEPAPEAAGALDAPLAADPAGAAAAALDAAAAAAGLEGLPELELPHAVNARAVAVSAARSAVARVRFMSLLLRSGTVPDLWTGCHHYRAAAPDGACCGVSAGSLPSGSENSSSASIGPGRFDFRYRPVIPREVEYRWIVAKMRSTASARAATRKAPDSSSPVAIWLCGLSWKGPCWVPS